MNQIAHMFKEGNKILAELNRNPKSVNLDVVNTQIKMIDVQTKLFGHLVSLHVSGAKDKRSLNGMERQGLIGKTSAVDLMLGDPEIDKVKCPYNNNLITRAECLDESGTHMERCEGCETGLETKRMLIPE